MPTLLQQSVFTFVGLAVLSEIAVATDGPDFTTLAVTPSVWLLESPEIRKKLGLDDQQAAQLDQILKEWKSDFLKARREYESRSESERRSPLYARTRDRDLMNSICNVLDDPQYQTFKRMLTLWKFGPVQSEDAFRFHELKVSEDQHRKLHSLNIDWVMQGLAEVEWHYKFQRPQEQSTRSRPNLSEWLVCLKGVARLAWKFKPKRDALWNRILTPEQARRWKERELQRAFMLDPFVVIVTNYEPRRQGHIPQTGKNDDFVVSYFTPPSAVLNFDKESQQTIRSLISEFQDWKPPAAEHRFEESLRRQFEFMKKIMAVMTPEQRSAWRNLVGEPGDQSFFKAWEASQK